MRIAKRALTVGLLLLATIQPAPAAIPPVPHPVPRAVCGPGSIPENATQGRVTAARLLRFFAVHPDAAG